MPRKAFTLYQFSTCKKCRFSHLRVLNKILLQEDSTERTAHVEGKKTTLLQGRPPHTHTLFLLLLFPPVLSLFSAFFFALAPSIPALCPGNVPTREEEEEERRGRGEPACQTWERREKGENSMWWRDREQTVRSAEEQD